MTSRLCTIITKFSRWPTLRKPQYQTRNESLLNHLWEISDVTRGIKHLQFGIVQKLLGVQNHVVPLFFCTIPHRVEMQR